MEKHTDEKKVWITPELIIHGDVETITREGPIGQKVYGDGDGAVWNSQDVKWAS